MASTSPTSTSQTNIPNLLGDMKLTSDTLDVSKLSSSKSTNSLLSAPHGQLLWRRRSATAQEIKETLDATFNEQQLNQYTLERVLGRGSYGIVHLAHDRDKNGKVAIKEFSKSKLTKLKRGRGRGHTHIPTNPISLVQTEVAIFKKLNHANVVKLFEVLDNPNGDSLYMVFECCENGPILDLSRHCDPYVESEARWIFQQIILGIEYLHANGISHRDIKPDNLLFSSDRTLKIVDFGVSEMFAKDNDKSNKSAGSPGNPELCEASHGDISSKACDIWSIGVTLYALVHGFLPFTGHSVIELYESIRNATPNYPDSCISDSLIDLLGKILVKDVSGRISIDGIRKHPWTTDDGRMALPSREDNCVGLVTYVTEDEIEKSVKRLNDLFTVIKAVSKLKRLSGHSRSNLTSPEQSAPPSPIHISTPCLETDDSIPLHF